MTPAQSELLLDLRLPDPALRFRFSRSGGPGGQNVNKLNTKATLYIELDALRECLGNVAMARLQQIAHGRMTDQHLIVASDEHRSQLANRHACLAKLRHLILRSRHRPRLRKPTRPSAAARERRLRAKQHRGQIKTLRRQPAQDL